MLHDGMPQFYPSSTACLEGSAREMRMASAVLNWATGSSLWSYAKLQPLPNSSRSFYDFLFQFRSSMIWLVFASGSKTVPTKYLFLGFIMFIVVFRLGGHVHPHCLGTYLTHARTLKAFVFKCYAMHWMSLHTSHMPKPNVTRVQSATEWTASVHTLHMPKPNVTRVQSATEWTASVHTLHVPKPNVTRVQSATEWTASVHTLHMPKPNVTRVQSATEWTASVHTLHMPKPNVTRVQSATEWTASVHTLHMPKPNVTRVQSATEWTASVHTLHMPKPNVTRVQSATEWTASVHTLHMPKPNVTRVQSATEWTASVHTLHMLRYILYTGPKLWNSCSSKADQTHRRAEDRGKKTRPASWLPEIGEHKEPLKHTGHVHGYRHHDVPDTH